MSDSPSPELALATMCCRWPFDEGARQEIRDAAELVVDWEQFAGILKRNRIRPLAHRALAQADVCPPEPVFTTLSEWARTAASQGLWQARESLLLQLAFEAAGVPSMVVKGAPLAILAYGDLGIKESCDIDLLVSPHDALSARDRLLDLGYRSNVEKLGAEEFGQVVQHGKEVSFHHPEKALSVDLHWRLTSYRRLMRGVDVHGPAQTVMLTGGALRTLADDALFAHLCIHGAVHNWSRLKWLADLAAFIGERSMEEIEDLHDAARLYGAGRSAAFAISLLELLFGIRPSPAVQYTLDRDAIVRFLTNTTLAGLTYRGGTVEHDTYTMPWLRAIAARFVFEPGRAHAFEEIRNIWNLPEDRVRLPLPRQLAFLYHWLRIPMWLGRLRRRVHRKLGA